jgi:membrane-associated phospholipid phosphatase
MMASLVGHIGALVVVWWVFVRTARGQFADTIALAGNTIGRARVDHLVTQVLDAISVLSLLAATALIGFIALARRRVVLAGVAILLIVGSNVTTQFLKYIAIHRPDLGVENANISVNSMPSGHTTVAASVAVALVLVVPPRLRGLAAVLGAGYAALTGVATLSAGWHRPSDAVAALIVVGGWAAGAGLLLVLAGRDAPSPPDAHPYSRDSHPYPPDAHPYAVVLLAGAGVALLAVAAMALWVSDQSFHTSVLQLGRRRLFAAYAGGAVGIAGTAALMMALVLSTVHEVVPSRGIRPRRPPREDVLVKPS